ncbi:MAG: 2-C-methyl-D-erythritol 4-phosphate cytidylyltransferase, partial [Deltaproteobacteria bacterium]|nr:2-C-methyl-D-erythritol 4-phosphate cytidylyltransferase [Deltaproteobacteria bacterium]
MNATAIIVAAGEGRRFGGETPKTFLSISGRPMLLRTLDRFFASRAIGKVIVVVADDQLSRAESLILSDSALKDRFWVLQRGGATRQESVRRGLEMIGIDADIIAIHDGARPFVSSSLIDHAVEVAREKGAVVVGLPVRDTIKVVSAEHWIESTPARSSLWEIQTPQVFRRQVILAAHAWGEREGIDVTDDAMLVEKIGERV